MSLGSKSFCPNVKWNGSYSSRFFAESDEGGRDDFFNGRQPRSPTRLQGGCVLRSTRQTCILVFVLRLNMLVLKNLRSFPEQPTSQS